MCNIEKQIEEFYKRNTACKICNSHENKDKLSNQRKIYYEESKDKLLQKKNDRYIHFIDLLRSYLELENRLKVLEETTDSKPTYLNDSENDQFFYGRNLFETTQKNYISNKTKIYQFDDI